MMVAGHSLLEGSGMLLGEVPFKAGPGGMARTLVEVVVMVETGTCGHGQGVRSTHPFSLLGGLGGGRGQWEGAGRLGPAL